jgi:nardilysin
MQTPTEDEGDDEEEQEAEDEEEEEDEEADGDDDDDDENGAEDSPGAGMKLAACAVDFNVGFFADQASGFEGISHFLEHMVFMGSEKYPGENHFSDWLSQHWGSENACTDSEQTTYYFECHPKHLAEGLDIFSGYFLNPLLKMDAVEREVTAVESEFERVVNNDATRVEAIMGHVSNDSHPYRVFGWGNRASLTENPLWKQGLIRDKLLEHWRKHYHAGRMSLTLLGEQTLDELQKMVADVFGDMRADGEAAISYASAGAPYLNQLPLRIDTTMIREGKQLDLVFTVPSLLRRAYKRKSTEYVEELIGHEGEGSLFASLKSRGLAERISAGVAAGGLADTTCCALFTVTIKLTDEGFSKVDDVISSFFQYVEMMRRTGPQEWSWREAKDLRGIEFRFKEEEGAAEYTEMLAMTMRRFEHEDVLRGEYAFDEFHRGDIEAVVDCITPRKCVYIVSDHAFDCDAPGVEREKWFDAPFSRSAVPEKKLAEWESNEPDAALRYPPRNVYIAERFEIKAGSAMRLETAKKAGVVPLDATTLPPAPLVSPPEIVHECALMRLWHRADDKFDQPRMSAYFHVSLPGIEDSPEAFVAADMLTLMIHDRLQDRVRYPAELASLNAGLDVVGQHTCLSLTFDGFDCKLPRLVQAYFSAVADFELDPARFHKVKEKRLKDLKNYGLKPGRQARSLLHQLLKRREASESSKIAALEAMEPETLTQFARAAWQGAAHVEGLIIGNVTAEEALEMGASVREAFIKSAPVAAEAFPKKEIAVVPPGDTRFALAAQNPEEGTNVVYVYYQHGVCTHDNRAVSLLVHQLIGEKLFDQLRTKEQLGYVASGSLETLYDVGGFRVTVESAFHSPKFVEERIDAFLRGFPKQVLSMDDAEFTKTRRSLVDSVLTMDVSLSAEADRHWTHVSNQKYQFYRGQIIAGLIDGVSKKEVVEWLEANLAPIAAAPNARRVTIHVHGKNHPLEAADVGAESGGQNALGADDVAALKKSWGYHPAQGDPTRVPELEMPPESMARLSNTDVDAARRKAEAAARAAARDGDDAPRYSNQWAQRLAERRAMCAAGCACLKPSGGGPFKMPRLTK